MRTRITGLRWWIITLLMLGSVVNYLARSTLGVAAPTLFAALHVTTREYSWIVGSFQAAYLLQPVAGFVIDVAGLKLGFALFAAAWSVVNMAHGLAGSWQGLAALRALLGVAEGAANPAGMKATAEWFPAAERGLASGLFNVGASVGAMLAPPLVAWAILHYSWQAAFVLTGGAGLVWTAFWLACYAPPDRHPALSERERRYIAAGQERQLAGGPARPSFRAIAARRTFWGIAIPRFLADPTWGTLTFWVPLYLSTVRHFDLKQIALFAWMPFLAADLGSVTGGAVSAALQRRGVPLLDARRWAFTLGACLMVGVGFVGVVESPYAAVALICLAGFAHQLLSVTVITMASDLFRRGEVATVAGMAGTLGNAGVLAFTLLVGGLVARVGYTPFFAALAVLDLVGAAVLWLVVSDA